jgi:glycosyltransferase involved in cell wall biosynthesis
MTGAPLALYFPTFALGGAERVMINLANRFAATDRPTMVIVDRAIGPLAAAVDPAVPVVDLGQARTALAAPALARALSRHRPWALLAALPHNNVTALVAGRLARFAGPTAISEHLLLDQELAMRGPIGRLALHTAIRATYGWCGPAFAVSPDAADAMARVSGLARARVTVVGNPVVPADLAARLAVRPADPWLADDGPPTLLSVGRLAPSKDLPTLIAAFARLTTSRAARLLLLGDGPERARIAALIAEGGLADRVRLVGAVADPLPWMAASAGLVMSSRHEGFGNVLVEAMACGRPVASTDCPGGPRWILDDGALGPLAPIGDATALADAMATILDQPVAAQRLVARAADFRIDAVAERYWTALATSARRHSASVLSR